MAKEIPLTQGLVAIVDDADYEYLSQFKWCARKAGNTYYAVRQENKRFICMHIQIIGRRPGLEIDHIDGNGLNNRRSNLRFVTLRQNQQNRLYRRYSKYHGVSWDKVNGK